MTTELSTYSFTEEDINLITFALRRLVKQATMANVSNDSKDLIDHIERMKKEKDA